MQIHVIVIQISIQRAFVTERGFKRVLQCLQTRENACVQVGFILVLLLIG